MPSPSSSLLCCPGHPHHVVLVILITLSWSYSLCWPHLCSCPHHPCPCPGLSCPCPCCPGLLCPHPHCPVLVFPVILIVLSYCAGPGPHSHSHPGHVVLSWSLSSPLLSWSSMSLLSLLCCPGPCSHPHHVDLVLVLPIPTVLIMLSCPGPCCPCHVVLTWSLSSLLYYPVLVLIVLTWSWSSPSLSSSSCHPVLVPGALIVSSWPPVPSSLC